MRFLQNALQDLIDGLEVASDRAGLEQAASRTARRLGFRWFAYLGSVEDETTIISSYPVAWVRHYRAQHFDRVDPVIRPQSFQRSFFWSDLDKWPTRDQRRLFAEASSFRVRCGVTVPIRGGGNSFAAFTLATDTDRDELGGYNSPAAIDVLQLMGLYYHTHVHAKLHLGLKCVEESPLTSRERQCLTWAARGKAMADTGKILGIARRTVEFHLDNARAKLDAATVSQAVAEAARRKLLPL